MWENDSEGDKQARWIDRQIKSKRWMKGDDGREIKKRVGGRYFFFFLFLKKVIERECERKKEEGRL